MNGLMISIIIHANHLSSTNLVSGGRRLSNELNGTNSSQLPSRSRVGKTSLQGQSWKKVNYHQSWKNLNFRPSSELEKVKSYPNLETQKHISV